MKRLLSIVASLLFAAPLLAQTTAVTATLQDTAGTAWANAKVLITWVGQGTPSTTSGQSFPLSIPATANSSGVFTATVTDVAYIVPANSTWQVCVTSAVSSPQTYCTNIPITGASENISVAINAVLVPPSLTGGPLTNAYADSELSAVNGNQYYRIGDGHFRCYSLGAWGDCSSNGGLGGTITPSPQYELSFFSAAGTSNTLTGSSTITTDAANDLLYYGTKLASGTTINGVSYSNMYGPGGIALSTSVAPINTSGTTWQYTLASAISTAAASAIQGEQATVTIGGFTGSGTGNNVTANITAATTTTISITNATGSVVNTGTPTIGFTSYSARVNVCLGDAVSEINGNQSAICDSTGEPSQVNSYYQITVGNGTGGTTGSTVVWKVQPDLYAHVILSGGSEYAILQLGGSDIECQSAQNSGCQVNNFSTTNGMYALYGTGATTGYRQMKGMWFKSIHGGTLASGNVAIIQAGYDGSKWEDDQFIDDATSNVGNGTVAVIGGNTFCCHSLFVNDTFDSEWGQTALSITSPQFDQTNALNFHDTTINTHGSTASGNPNLLIADPTNHQVNISFTGVTYMEGQSATMTAPWIQDNGARALEFTGTLTTFTTGGTGTTSPIIAVGATNGFDTNLNIGNVVQWQGNGTNPYTWPTTIVEQYNVTTDCASPPCAVAVTDSNGNSVGYHSRTSQFNNVSIGGGEVVGGATGGNEGKGTVNATAYYINGSVLSSNIAGGALGSAVYQTGSGATGVTAAQTSSSTLCLTETGTGSAGAAPTWGSCAGSAATAFSALTGSTNMNAAMLVGSGASLAPTGTGTIQATSLGTFTGANPYAGTTTGSVNAMVATLSPAPTALSQLLGVPVTFLPNLANTTSTPTLNVNSLGAETITKGSGTVLSVGDLATTVIAEVIWNGTNFVLQNPQVGIVQTTGGLGGTSFASGQLKTTSIVSNSGVTSGIGYYGGSNSASTSSTIGAVGINNSTNSGTGGGSSTNIYAGAATGGGQQGFANIQQSFTIAAATTIGYVMQITSTADRVVAAALGSTNIVGIATTVGGTAAQLWVASEGKVLVVFDGTPVVGDYACAPPASIGTIGLAHDNGTTACPTGQQLGVVTGQVSGTGSGATATVNLQVSNPDNLSSYQLAPTSNAITSATAGTGITSVTCATASCTNLRGTYTMAATTVSAGTILTLVWPTTTAAYACWTSQDGGATPFGISHSVATATGMTVSVAVSIATGSITFDYGCQP